MMKKNQEYSDILEYTMVIKLVGRLGDVISNGFVRKNRSDLFMKGMGR